MSRVAFLRSALFYLCGFAGAAVLAAFLLGVGRPRTAPPDAALDNAAMAAWMLAITSLPAAGGFAAVACVARAWRSLRARAVAPISAACGALGYVGWLTGLGVAAGFAIPFPLGALGAALRLVLPGALLGAAALGVARAMRLSPAGEAA
jgi:hypothetical protein